MKCIDDELLQRFHDGESQDDETNMVKLHMSMCPDCEHRYINLQSRVIEIKLAFDILCPENIEIPPFKNPVPEKKHISLRWKYLIPLLAAASLLLFALVFNKNESNKLNGDQMLHSSFILELDANKPVDMQEFSFTAISPEGKVSEHIVRQN